MLTTLELLAALKTRLSALTVGSTSEPLFERIEYYSEPDLLRALQEIRVFKKRVCILIPAGDTFETETAGNSSTLAIKIEREVVILLGDRDVTKPQEASTGGDGNPGVVAMKDQVFDALVNHDLSLGQYNLFLRPTDSQPLTIADETEAPGRRAWQMSWIAHAGTEHFNQQTET
jgi:hypothetical protein